MSWRHIQNYLCNRAREKKEKDGQKGKKMTGIKKKVQKKDSGMIKVFIITAVLTNAFAFNAFATSQTAVPQEVLQPLNLVKALFIAVASAVGVIIVVKNLVDIGVAINQKDQHTIWSSLQGLAGGLIIAFIGIVLAFLGF